MRRISDLTRRLRIRAHAGIGKAPKLKAMKGRVMKGKKNG
jgi:hypothetical protein